MAYDPSNTSFTKTYYTVKTTGDTWFKPTLGLSDSPDYTASKTQALAQCLRMTPHTASTALELVAS